MDKSIEGAASTTFSGTIHALDKTEWQTNVDLLLQALLTDNDSLKSSVCTLQTELSSLRSELRSMQRG